MNSKLLSTIMNHKKQKSTNDRENTLGVSMTKPGQSLHPSELLKRHLAGTLPDIQKRPQYTYDENGQQISEDLSQLELHELHDLARQLRNEYDKRASNEKEEQEKLYRQQIIDQYVAQHQKPEEPTPTPEPPAI